MATINCEVSYTELTGDHGREIPGVVVTCGKCGECTESFGQGDNSVRRCFALLSEGCDEDNYYKDEDK